MHLRFWPKLWVAVEFPTSLIVVTTSIWMAFHKCEMILLEFSVIGRLLQPTDTGSRQHAHAQVGRIWFWVTIHLSSWRNEGDTGRCRRQAQFELVIDGLPVKHCQQRDIVSRLFECAPEIKVHSKLVATGPSDNILQVTLSLFETNPNQFQLFLIVTRGPIEIWGIKWRCWLQIDIWWRWFASKTVSNCRPIRQRTAMLPRLLM